MPGTATNPSVCTAFVRMSESCETISLSKNRPKKCRASIRNVPMSGLPHHGGDLARGRPYVLLPRQLPEDLLQRRQMHQLAPAPDLVIRHDLPLIEHDHPRTHFLGDLENVRDVEERLARARQL